MSTASAKTFLRNCGLPTPVTVWIEPRKVCATVHAGYPVEATPLARYQTLLFGWKAVRDFLTFDPINNVIHRTIEGFLDFDLSSAPLEVITYTANEYYFWEFMADHVREKQQAANEEQAVWTA